MHSEIKTNHHMTKPALERYAGKRNNENRTSPTEVTRSISQTHSSGMAVRNNTVQSATVPRIIPMPASFLPCESKKEPNARGCGPNAGREIAPVPFAQMLCLSSIVYVKHYLNYPTFTPEIGLGGR